MLFAACIVCFVQGFTERSNVENLTEWIEIVFFVVVRFSYRKLTALLLQANMSSSNLQYIVTVGCNSCLWSHFWHLSKKKFFISQEVCEWVFKDRCVCVVSYNGGGKVVFSIGIALEMNLQHVRMAFSLWNTPPPQQNVNSLLTLILFQTFMTFFPYADHKRYFEKCW